MHTEHTTRIPITAIRIPEKPTTTPMMRCDKSWPSTWLSEHHFRLVCVVTWQCPHCDRLTVDPHIFLLVDSSYWYGVVGGGSESSQCSLSSWAPVSTHFFSTLHQSTRLLGPPLYSVLYNEAIDKSTVRETTPLDWDDCGAKGCGWNIARNCCTTCMWRKKSA